MSSGDGGQFTAIIPTYNSDGTVGKYTVFQTFCVDTSHYFTPGQTYNYVISDQTSYGKGNYISIGTAYLYNDFINHTLPGYSFAGGTSQNTDAGLLQSVLWALQGESWQNSQNYVNSSNPFYNDIIKEFGSLQAAEAASDGAYGVEALDIYDSSGDACQSQLIEVASPVPEPSTIWAGLLIIIPLGVGVFRSFQKSRSLVV
jgi:hypothetical protein